MGNQRIFKDFFKYVSLNILGQMAYSCYTLADTFFVSAKLGADGLAALNLAFPVFCLINGTGLMIGMGGGTNYAVGLVMGFAILFVFAGVFFSKAITRILGANDAVFSMTNTYLLVMLLFAPAFLSNHLLQCFVRNDGKPSLAMAAMIAESLSNVALDYCFIFPLDMGIFGAIFATGLAPVISILVMTPYLAGRKKGFHRIRRALNGRLLVKLCSGGLPPFLTEAASGVVMLLFNFIILRIAGNVGVAAFSVITVLSLVTVAIYTGLSQGIQPILSRNYGEQHMGNVKVILKAALLTLLVISAAVYSIVCVGAEALASVFNGEGSRLLQWYAAAGLRLYFTACPFTGLNIVLSTYFLSTEKTFPAQVISLLRSFVILIPMAFFLSSLFKMTGVWCAYPLTEGIVAFIGIWLLCRTSRGKQAKFQ